MLCVLVQIVLWDLDQALAIIRRNIMLCRQDLGFDHRKNSVVDIVGMDLSSNSFFDDLVSFRGNMLVSDGY